MEKENLSLRKAGKQADVAHTTIDRILKDESVDLDTVQKVCDWLGIPPSSVLDTNEDRSENIDLVAQLFALNDEFSQVFVEISEKIKDKLIDEVILDEITGYASYRLHQHLARKE